MKAITLLALVTMTRPSDIAPKGKVYNPTTKSMEPVVMSRDDVVFNNDGSMTITFWAIKNDTNRQGFEVNIPPSSESTIDPVECLKTYISRSEHCRTDHQRPLFVSLNAPYKAISADTVGNILENSIKEAGLSDKGFTAKSFRPTAATQAISVGTLPETAMKVGRWKTKEVFLNHYVYGRVEPDFTSKMLEAGH